MGVLNSLFQVALHLPSLTKFMNYKWFEMKFAPQRVESNPNVVAREEGVVGRVRQAAPVARAFERVELIRDNLQLEIGILLPNNQRRHRTFHIQKDVLPCALC